MFWALLTGFTAFLIKLFSYHIIFADDLYGDFEDLETGEVHHGKDNQSGEDGNMSDEGEEDEEEDKMKEGEKEMTDKEKRLAKKRKLKQMFDADYDDQDGDGGTYFDDLKQQMDEQAKVNMYM